MSTNGLLSTLALFSGTNGDEPEDLTVGNDGNFYGVANFGGNLRVSPIGGGTVFRVSTNGSLTTLVSFAGTNGENPNPLILGNDGNFYGTTTGGGSANEGAVFRVTTNGVLTELIAFSKTNGAGPEATLVLGNDGNLYGTALNGGNLNLNGGQGFGTVFQISPAPPPALGLGAYGNQPAAFFPAATGTNYVLQITTNSASGIWVTCSNGIPLTGLIATNAAGNGFFRLKLTPPPASAPGLGISSYGGQPAIFFPTPTGTNYLLQTSTNIATGNWATLSQGVLLSGLVITNAPANASFRLH